MVLFAYQSIDLFSWTGTECFCLLWMSSLLDPSPFGVWPVDHQVCVNFPNQCHNQLQRWKKTSIETLVFEFDTCEFLEEIMCANVGCDALMGFTRHLNKFGEAARFLLGALQYTVSISLASVNNSTLCASSSTCFRMLSVFTFNLFFSFTFHIKQLQYIWFINI